MVSKGDVKWEEEAEETPIKVNLTSVKVLVLKST